MVFLPFRVKVEPLQEQWHEGSSASVNGPAGPGHADMPRPSVQSSRPELFRAKIASFLRAERRCPRC